jgi:hypothetical protein
MECAHGTSMGSRDKNIKALLPFVCSRIWLIGLASWERENF